MDQARKYHQVNRDLEFNQWKNRLVELSRKNFFLVVGIIGVPKAAGLSEWIQATPSRRSVDPTSTLGRAVQVSYGQQRCADMDAPFPKRVPELVGEPGRLNDVGTCLAVERALETGMRNVVD